MNKYANQSIDQSIKMKTELKISYKQTERMKKSHVTQIIPQDLQHNT